MKQQLTPKQQKLIDHFITNRSKVDAYRHAYNCDNMKPATIQRRASEEFDKPYIALACFEIIDEVSKEVKIDAAWVLKRAGLLADFNIRKFIKTDDHGNAVYDFSEATDDDWYCISEYTVDSVGPGSDQDTFLVSRIKLKTVDKIAALKLVGAHIDVGAFKDQLEVGGHIVQVSMTADEYKAARKEMLAADDC